VPYTRATPERHNVRLLRLALLQIAILTATTGCYGDEDGDCPRPHDATPPSTTAKALFAADAHPAVPSMNGDATERR
jgi:hypothetical protein